MSKIKMKITKSTTNRKVYFYMAYLPDFQSGSDEETEEIIEVKSDLGITDYSEVQYWVSRYYKSLDHFEWYMSYERIKPVISKYIKGKQNALYVGCGTSTIGVQLFKEGIPRVKNIDVCQIVIEEMYSKFNSEKSILWEIQDVTKLSEKSNTFDLIFEKATIDALMCSDISSRLVSKMLSEVYRVLQNGGVFISVSNGSEDLRRSYFEAMSFDQSTLTVFTIDKLPIPGSYYYVYVFEKNARLS